MTRFQGPGLARQPERHRQRSKQTHHPSGASAPLAAAGWRAVRSVLVACLASLACAAQALDMNSARQAELEQVKGIGVALSERILKERERSPFADWADLMQRVPGMGRRTAERLSAQGVTVGGQAYTPAPARP